MLKDFPIEAQVANALFACADCPIRVTANGEEIALPSGVIPKAQDLHFFPQTEDGYAFFSREHHTDNREQPITPTLVLTRDSRSVTVYAMETLVAPESALAVMEALNMPTDDNAIPAAGTNGWNITLSIPTLLLRPRRSFSTSSVTLLFAGPLIRRS